MKNKFILIGAIALFLTPLVMFADTQTSTPEPYYDPATGLCTANCPGTPTQPTPDVPAGTVTNPYAGAAASSPESAGNTPVYNTANPAPLTSAPAPAATTPAPAPTPTTPATTQTTAPANTNCPNGGTLVNGACNLGYTPLEPIPGVNTTNIDFPTLLGNIYKVAITIGALFAVAMLTVSGIRYMLSDVVTDKDKAKKRIAACIYGLVLIAASWLILNTINPQLVTFNLNPGTGTVTAPLSSATNSATGADPTQNLGDPTKFSNFNPYGFSSLSLTQGYAVTQALGCSAYNVACLGAQQYITYDSDQINTPAVQQAITDYNSNCSGASNLWIGNVKTIDGAVVGAPGQTALVCAGPLQ